MTRKSTLTFWGGAGTVTGANFLFESGSLRLLVDCGLIQGSEFCDQCNYDPFPYNPKEIGILFATHAHADHIGRIPKLVKEGFTNVIYSTAATRDLAEVMLEDAVGILKREALRLGRRPLYDSADVRKALNLWKTVSYHETIPLGEGFSAILKDAGHILGSAMVELSREGRRIVFTGDLGNSPSILMPDTEKVEDATYLVMESVYGNRTHEAKDDRSLMLQKAVEDTVKRGGTLVIPSFSIERTQTILYELNKLFEQNIIPSVPVFLDSPLAIKVTDIYRRYTKLLNDKVQEEVHSGDDVFDFPSLSLTASSYESREIVDVPSPKIIIAGAGMSGGGRIVQHEKEHLSDAKNMLLLVGYQVAGSLGRKIQDGAKEVVIFNERVPIRAEVRTIRGFSGHRDSVGLVAFVEQTAESLERVFVVMGEPKASLFLVQRLRDYLGVHAISPEKGESFELQL